METKFNSQICTTREQSERLLSLGLKKETADCAIYYSELWGRDRAVQLTEDGFDVDEIPAWSLHRLIAMMPEDINNMLWFSMGKQEVNYDSIHYIKNFSKSTTLYDNLIDCIEWLIENEYYNKEYLV